MPLEMYVDVCCRAAVVSDTEIWLKNICSTSNNKKKFYNFSLSFQPKEITSARKNCVNFHGWSMKAQFF